MGCDTSKESVQPGEDDVKEDVKNGDIPKATENISSKDQLRKSPGPSKKGDEEEEGAEVKGEDSSESAEKQREAAATTIQAVFRGYNVRKKSMKSSQSHAGQIQQISQTNGNENGEMAIKHQIKAIENIADSTFKEGEAAEAPKNELDDIDLADEKLHSAAATIQVGFRRHMKRKEEVGCKTFPVNNGNSK